MQFLVSRVSIFLLLFLWSTAYTQQGDNDIKPKSYTTRAIDTAQAPVIDGLINDPAWDLVPFTGEFKQLQPDIGEEPSEQTQFKILYDDKFIYVAFRCFDSDPEGIVKRLSRRDGFEGDWVEIAFDSYNDDRTAFSFTITAAGVKGDEFISNNGDFAERNSFDDSWNPIWYTKTSSDDLGWTAELKIPLSQLRFGKAEEQIWGLQAKRFYFRNTERSMWQELEPNFPGYVSGFGELRGLKNLKPQKQLEIQPYVVTQLDTYEAESGNPFRDGNDAKLNGGLDAKIGITNDLTLDLTINPDFGQVDADPAAIALDGFQIFFQERRPFFVENKNIFTYEIGNGNDNVFYSRRIGRSPQGNGFGPATAYVDQPQNTTILGAAKFSGKTKNGWSIGLLQSITAKEFATRIDTNGTRSEKLVEPFTNYSVARVQKDFNNRNSYVGGIFTSTNRKLVPQLDFLHENAFTAGLDFKHNWKDRTYFAQGTFTASHVTGSREAITNTQASITHLFNRVDATHVRVDTTRTSLTGTGGNFSIGKAGNGNWSYNGGVVWRSPELELNDVGFLRQADEIVQTVNVRRVFQNSTDWYRQMSYSFQQRSTYDFEGNYNRMQYEVGGDINWANNWFTEFGASHKPRIYINTTLRGGPRWKFNEENFWYLFAGTDRRKKLSLVAGYVMSRATQHNFSLDRYELRLNYQPFNALSLSLSTEYEKNPNKTQYVTQKDYGDSRRYITAAIDQRTLSATLRANFNITPNMTIQYYGQPFVSRGLYSQFNYVADATAEDLNNRITLYEEDQISQSGNTYEIDENRDGSIDYTFQDPDFSFVQLRTNLVFRWEYIPGSELFFVWSQGLNGANDPAQGLFEAWNNQILNRRPGNTFLIKATYRFVL
ncbi:DUF5916 domain-containing protein [Leeuwenhoekiella nanhaiensis]|uniref:Hydrolase n=1 Tax=Leeuwenhoekiella nanhaiensis TaxID=1655491 RepID=A0A2G1VWD8_9FLAO|nr:DUF5916 domain-containing protein [Leeuwenhoekiella nanhaiensis]PHQ31092.1 hydrolase [Leeuwenhoekiella nanhaiensis]